MHVCGCYIIGSGKGIVSNHCDIFNNETCHLKVFIYSKNISANSISYTIKNDDIKYFFYTSRNNIKLDYSFSNPDMFVLYGTGYAEKTECDKIIKDTVKFKILINILSYGKQEFVISIKSEKNPQLDHDSGIVQFKNSDSNTNFEYSCS